MGEIVGLHQSRAPQVVDILEIFTRQVGRATWVQMGLDIRAAVETDVATLFTVAIFGVDPAGRPYVSVSKNIGCWKLNDITLADPRTILSRGDVLMFTSTKKRFGKGYQRKFEFAIKQRDGRNVCVVDTQLII